MSAMKPFTRTEALEILNEYGTPPHIIAHCQGVADVAVRIGEKLNEAGCNLDLEMIDAAGMLHDMARLEPDHQTVAADWCKARGHDAEAEIIAAHMTRSGFNPIDKVDEMDLVCFADRVVREDEYVGPEQRIESLIEKRKPSPEHKQKLLSLKRELLEYTAILEERMGTTLDELFK